MKMWGSMDEKLKITDFFDCAIVTDLNDEFASNFCFLSCAIPHPCGVNV